MPNFVWPGRETGNQFGVALLAPCMHSSCKLPRASWQEPAEYYKRLTALARTVLDRKRPKLNRPGAGQNQRPELISTGRQRHRSTS